VRLGLGVAVVEVLGDGGVEGVVDERRLARAGDAGDAGEEADRDRDVDALQVVAARAGDAQPLVGAVADRRLGTGMRSACESSGR
jgi:hypothetical protein